jgi:hypothetical protein
MCCFYEAVDGEEVELIFFLSSRFRCIFLASVINVISGTNRINPRIVGDEITSLLNDYILYLERITFFLGGGGDKQATILCLHAFLRACLCLSLSQSL